MTKMTVKEYEGAIEAILFAMGNSVELEKIANALEISCEDTEKILQKMMNEYESGQRGIRIIRLENSFQMVTKEEYYEQLTRVATAPKKPVMTDVMLEVLSIVAYKQPVTRGEIERIRGVSSDHALNRLVEYHLVEEVGRLDAIGRPILFATTEDFLRNFGVSSISDLPSIDSSRIDEYTQEAIRETGGDLHENVGDIHSDQIQLHMEDTEKIHEG